MNRENALEFPLQSRGLGLAVRIAKAFTDSNLAVQIPRGVGCGGSRAHCQPLLGTRKDTHTVISAGSFHTGRGQGPRVILGY